MSGPAAGWYPHPHDPAMLRWWDGDAWTEHVQPKPSTTPMPSPAPLGEDSAATTFGTASGLSASGWDTSAPAFSSAGVGAVGTMTPSADVYRDSTAPWQTDLQPAMAEVSAPTAPQTNGTVTGNGNGNGYAAVREPQRAPFDPPPWTDPSDPVEAETGGSGRTRKMLIAAVLVAAVALGGIAYKQGLLDKVLGKSGSSSSDSMQVIEGKTYSFEAPRTWKGVSAEPYGADYGFVTPSSAVVVLDSSTLDASANLSDPTARQTVFDTALKGLQLQLSGLAVASKTPYETGGVIGEQTVLTGMGADGQATRVVNTVFVHGNLVVVVGMIAHGASGNDPANQSEYDALLKSFQYPSS